MFANFLIKSIGYTEEFVSRKDIFVHPLLWTIGGAFFYTVLTKQQAAANVITLIILATLPIFVVVSTIYIVVSQRRAFAEKGEVQSPLISTRHKDKIASFQIRLIILMILALASAVNVPLIVFLSWEMNKDFDYDVGWSQEVLNAVIMACALTGFFISFTLATTPELKRYVKNKRARRSTALPVLNG